jgi:AcrR family transcriptional regulator
LSRRAVSDAQRLRIMVATAQLVARDGYGATRIADIASLAGVSRSTFYELFRDKEQLFLACYQAGEDAQRARVQAALANDADAAGRLRAGVLAYLEGLEMDEDFAQAFFVDAQVATPAIRERFVAVQAGYVELLQDWHAGAGAEHPGLADVPADLWTAVVAGIVGLCTDRIRKQGSAGLTAAVLEPALLLLTRVSGLDVPR